MREINIPIPLNMRHLKKDRRGYPVPCTVLLDTDGRPHFSINDSAKEARLGLAGKCGICGNKIKGVSYFAGGPMSAFMEAGAYGDGPLHHSCAHFAVQTCPYLAAPKYSRRIDDGTIDLDKIPPEYSKLFLDRTRIPTRPDFFVVAGCKKYETQNEIHLTFKPRRPWVKWSAYLKGRKLSYDEAYQIMVDSSQYDITKMVFANKTRFV